MRARGRLTFRLLFAAFLVAGAVAAGAAGAEDPGALRGQADALGAENAELGEAARSALLGLYSLESELGRAERRLAALEERQADLARRQASAREALRHAREAESVAQKQLGDRLRALYVEGETDPLEVILGASSLDEAISALDGLERLAAEDDRIIAQVERTREGLGRALEALRREEAELAGSLAAARAARDSLAAARDEKAAYLDSLRRRQDLNEAEIASLERRAAAAEERSAELTASAGTEDAGSHEIAGAAVSPALDAVAPAGGGRQLTVDAVAYSLPGYTASGLPVGKGVVAVDPTVIPLGTRLYVPGYGPAVAADVGTAIKGLIIDLWFPTYEQAAAWGRQTVTITVYG
jgi:3D (Asp-Asp-Asp) domain-containing protein